MCADKIRWLQPSLANSMSLSWALFADKYTATLTSCAHRYLSTKGKNMQKTVLNEVYDLLKKIGAVDNESEFSKDWLARSECYMRTLRFKQANPSVVT